MQLQRWRADRWPGRGWWWIGLDVLAAYVSATISIGPSDVTASAFHGPAVVRVAAVVWFVAISARRFAPALALWGAAAATVAVAVTGNGHALTNLSLASALAATMVAQSRPRAVAREVIAIPVVAAVAALWFGAGTSAAVLALIAHACAWLAGDSARVRWEADAARRRQQEAWVRLRAEAARQQAERAIAEERARLAGELHDAVGHAVTVMVTHAGAARLSLGPGHDGVTGALRRIEAVGRTAMEDLEHILRLLEPGEAGRRPLLDSVRALVDALPSAVAVELRAAELDALDGPLAAAVHRVVQESLTNILRYAAPTSASVYIGHDGDEVRVLVHDTGRSATGSGERPPAERSGGGRGLSGMAERVRMLGGTCEAGPTPEGGWRVSARLPVPATSA